MSDPNDEIGVALPRLGVLIDGAGWALKGNVGAFARPPDLTELYGDRGALVGNPSLESERGVQADLGPTFEADGIRLEMVAFFARYQDLIVWTVGPQGVARPENIDRADTGGVELAVGVERGRWTNSANATVNRAVNRRTDTTYLGRQLPRVPVFDAGVTGAVTVGPARFSVDGTFAAGTWADTANFHRLPARTFLGATSGVGDRASVELDVRNVLDTIVAEVPLDPLVDTDVRGPQPIVDFTGYPLPGRSVFVTLTDGSGARALRTLPADDAPGTRGGPDLGPKRQPMCAGRSGPSRESGTPCSRKGSDLGAGQILVVSTRSRPWRSTDFWIL